MRKITTQKYIDKILLPNKNKIRKMPQKAIIKCKSPTYPHAEKPMHKKDPREKEDNYKHGKI